ncbi:MAG: hypothetical protein ACI8V2_003730 [Candidatus Latescibacterota bacterium]|jgi:hypothetical protein
MPIIQNTMQQQSQQENHPVSTQDRELAVLYWKLQKRVHTDPKVRGYLHELARQLKKRQIRPTALNDVGLEMALDNQI